MYYYQDNVYQKKPTPPVSQKHNTIRLNISDKQIVFLTKVTPSLESSSRASRSKTFPSNGDSSICQIIREYQQKGISK